AALKATYRRTVRLRRGSTLRRLRVARDEPLHLVLDDRLRPGGLTAAAVEVGLHDALEVVDVVQPDPGEVARAGVDVARDRDVDQDPAALRHVARCDDRSRSVRRGDHHVGGAQLAGEVLEADGAAAEAGGEPG